MHVILDAINQTNIIDYESIWYSSNLGSVINYHPLLNLMSKTIWNEDFSIVEELNAIQHLSQPELQHWRTLEQHLKSKELSTINYKIGAVNQVLKLILDDVKEGIKNWSLMDPKYFGHYGDVIKKWQKQIDKVNEFLRSSPKITKIPYFGWPPKHAASNHKLEQAVSEYYKEYLFKVGAVLNPNLDEYLVRELVQETVTLIGKRYSCSPEENKEINSKLGFYTIVKLVEKSLRFRKIKCMYNLYPLANNLETVLQKFWVQKVLDRAKTKGMFSIEEITSKFDADHNWYLVLDKVSKKREEKEKRKQDKSQVLTCNQHKRFKSDYESIKKFKEQQSTPRAEVRKTVSPYEDYNLDDIDSFDSEE